MVVWNVNYHSYQSSQQNKKLIQLPKTEATSNLDENGKENVMKIEN